MKLISGLELSKLGTKLLKGENIELEDVLPEYAQGKLWSRKGLEATDEKELPYEEYNQFGFHVRTLGEAKAKKTKDFEPLEFTVAKSNSLYETGNLAYRLQLQDFEDKKLTQKRVQKLTGLGGEPLVFRFTKTYKGEETFFNVPSENRHLALKPLAWNGEYKPSVSNSVELRHTGEVSFALATFKQTEKLGFGSEQVNESGKVPLKEARAGSILLQQNEYSYLLKVATTASEFLAWKYSRRKHEKELGRNNKKLKQLLKLQEKGALPPHLERELKALS